MAVREIFYVVYNPFIDFADIRNRIISEICLSSFPVVRKLLMPFFKFCVLHYLLQPLQCCLLWAAASNEVQ
jgi:hypothetical protein